MEITRDRTILPFVKKTLPEKMVFIGGPRQVGKTTLSLHLLETMTQKGKPSTYLNWDISKDRKALLSGELPPSSKLYVLDEIHKYAKWRNLVKGYYDSSQKKRSFVVTGSARLNYQGERKLIAVVVEHLPEMDRREIFTQIENKTLTETHKVLDQKLTTFAPAKAPVEVCPKQDDSVQVT